MKTNAKVQTNVQKFNEVANVAKKSIKEVSHNLLYWVRVLNKFAAKNDFIDNKSVLNIAVLAKDKLSEETQSKMKKNQYFHAALFAQDYLGRACTVRKYSGAISKNEVLQNEVITDKGKQIILDASGDNLCILCPVSLSLSGVFGAFCEVLKKDAQILDNIAREEKRREREETRAQNAKKREFNKLFKDLQKQYKNGEISGNTFRYERAKLEDTFCIIAA